MTFDLAPVKIEAEDRIRLLQKAEDVVVGNPEVLHGEPCLKGTRMPVYLVAEMREAGTSVDEMLRSYPSLTADLIEKASIYAAAYPKRGRPAEPIWRKDKPVERISVPKRKSADVGHRHR